MFGADCLSSLARVEALAHSLEEPADYDHEDNELRAWLLSRLADFTAKCDEAAHMDMQVGSRLRLAEAFKNAEEALRDARRDLESAVVEELPVGAVVGDAEIVWGNSTTKVDWEALMPRVKAGIADDRTINYDEAGELLPPAERISRSIDRLHEVIGFSVPKKPGLKKLGLDIDEFATVRGGPKVRWAKK